MLISSKMVISPCFGRPICTPMPSKWLDSMMIVSLSDASQLLCMLLAVHSKRAFCITTSIVLSSLFTSHLILVPPCVHVRYAFLTHRLQNCLSRPSRPVELYSYRRLTVRKHASRYFIPADKLPVQQFMTVYHTEHTNRYSARNYFVD